jgi:hypothetical protein
MFTDLIFFIREEAEAVLGKEGLTEGLFLVRESSTSQGDFVLRQNHGQKL